MSQSVEFLGWNIEQGGYDRRHIFDTDGMFVVPEREAAIQKLISTQHTDGVDTLALTDTYGWRERYGTDKAIADHLGFSRAAFIDLGDERVDRIYGPGAGLTFATDHQVAKIAPLDLENRQGIQAIIELGGKALQVATLYLDDMNEAVRHRQLEAALFNLEQDERTVLIGDLNTLRPNLDGASIRTKAQDLGFRAVAFGISLLPRQTTLDSLLARIDKQDKGPTINYYRQALTNLNRRQIVPALEQRGFKDADPKKRPTFHKLGRLGVDYAFHTPDLHADKFQVVPAGEASDHDAIRVRMQLANSLTF